MNFTTTIMRPVTHHPLTHLAAAAEDVNLEDEVEVEVEVEVEFLLGWETPAYLSGPPEDCYPGEGEDPEILSVVIEKTGEDILDDLLPNEHKALVAEAWGTQRDLGPY